MRSFIMSVVLMLSLGACTSKANAPTPVVLDAAVKVEAPVSADASKNEIRTDATTDGTVITADVGVVSLPEATTVSE